MFEWDEKKAALNLEKHGVSFEEAQTVFDDSFFLVYPDHVHSVGEPRYVILGESSEWRALVVVYTERGSTIRIISAREADKQEQRDYEEEKYK
jgi:uncharacterized DUF497 family protein